MVLIPLSPVDQPAGRKRECSDGGEQRPRRFVGVEIYGTRAFAGPLLSCSGVS
jgi:hypothetical protein